MFVLCFELVLLPQDAETIYCCFQMKTTNIRCSKGANMKWFLFDMLIKTNKQIIGGIRYA